MHHDDISNLVDEVFLFLETSSCGAQGMLLHVHGVSLVTLWVHGLQRVLASPKWVCRNKNAGPSPFFVEVDCVSSL
jgi:hypothetical protein